MTVDSVCKTANSTFEQWTPELLSVEQQYSLCFQTVRNLLIYLKNGHFITIFDDIPTTGHFRNHLAYIHKKDYNLLILIYKIG